MWQKLKLLQKMGMLKKVISLWNWLLPWGTLWWISIDIMICKLWESWFVDLLMAIFSLLECFLHIIITYIRAVRCSSAGLFLHLRLLLWFRFKDKTLVTCPCPSFIDCVSYSVHQYSAQSVGKHCLLGLTPAENDRILCILYVELRVTEQKCTTPGMFCFLCHYINSSFN